MPRQRFEAVPRFLIAVCLSLGLSTPLLAQRTDRAVISEVPFDVEKLARFIDKDRAENPSNYAILTISEGAHLVGGQGKGVAAQVNGVHQLLRSWE